MPALPVLSVEVWQMILRFSISITGFLDPDTFEGDLMAHGFRDADRSTNDEATYWESERTKNALQRVCKAWCTYLRHFENRYVRMGDIMHRRIDKKSIEKATRISFYRDQCTCREVCLPSAPGSEWAGSSGSVEANSIFLRFCYETVVGLHDLPAEIIDIDGSFGASLWNARALRSLKEVKVVTSWGFVRYAVTHPLLSQTPSLKHLHGMVHDNLQHLEFISRTLVTLSLRVEREESYKTFILDLPALRHLRIDFGGRMKPSIFFENILVPFFGKVGGRLRSFYIGVWDHQYQMPVEIWERCPHLEIFHPGLALPVSAPVLHRLHTLSVTSECLVQTLRLQWPNLRRLILDGRWSEIHDRKRLSEHFSLWRSKLQGRGVTFEDLDGIALASVMKMRGLI